MRREEVAVDDQWDLESLYKNSEEWHQDFRTKNFDEFKGTITKGPKALADFLEVYFEKERHLHKLYTYAHLKHDEDVAHDDAKKMEAIAKSALFAFAENTSWVEPEILSLDEEEFKKLINSPELAKFRFHLEKLYRMKPHTLSKEEERLLALAGKPLETPSRTFSSLSNADFAFGKVEDGSGTLLDLTYGSYQKYLLSQDRTLRKNAYKTLFGHFGKFQNTLSDLISGAVEKHEFYAKAKNFKSCLEAALYPHNISPKVYKTLIESVNKRLPDLHRYYAIRERLLNIGPLHLYDMSVPLVKEVNFNFTYQEAEDLVIESVKPLGSAYQETLARGLKKDAWVDRYENKNKRSGAYSSGCYDSHPYILMNFKGILRDVYTLAHEAGHSMHSHLSKTQNYHESSYPIFLAEVASTFNEELLTKTLLEKLGSEQERMFLLQEQIENIIALLFRQTMFAEFELKIHELAEQKIPLTPKLLSEEYMALNRKYYGDKVIFDEECQFVWSRIPHFYYNFYVYQYATGVSAALALSEGVLKGSDKERDLYLGFLKSGSTDYPLNILLKAGVDMSRSDPIDRAIDHFSALVTELEKLAIKKKVC